MSGAGLGLSTSSMVMMASNSRSSPRWRRQAVTICRDPLDATAMGRRPWYWRAMSATTVISRSTCSLRSMLSRACEMMPWRFTLRPSLASTISSTMCSDMPPWPWNHSGGTLCSMASSRAAIQPSRYNGRLSTSVPSQSKIRPAVSARTRLMERRTGDSRTG